MKNIFKDKISCSKNANLAINFKFLIVIPFLVISSVCYSQKSEREDYIILSGKIENISKQVNGKKSIQLTFPFYIKNKKSKDIILAEDGTFKDSVNSAEGLYYIFDGANQIQMYLRESKHYQINYDASHFMSGGPVTLDGYDVDVNKYFIEKMQKRIYVDRLNTQRSEEDFRQYLDSLKRIQINRLEKSKLPKDIRLEEAKSIEYEYLSELFFFLVQMKDLPLVSLSKKSQDELNIDYSNEKDYKIYGYYAKLVYMYYQQKCIDFYGRPRPENIFTLMPTNVLKQLDSLIPNKYIKNDIIKLDARYYLELASDKNAYYNDFKKYYTGSDDELKESIYETYLRISKLKKGTPSAEFYNLQDYNGGFKSLKDFRGKYVYIDIWATWCGNCWGEFPYLKKLEEDYKGENIVFLSLSWDKFEDKWIETIKKEEMGGVQLLAKNTEDPFFVSYAVKSIPRYILIDPDGLIVDYNAPRPSDSEKIEMLFKNVKKQ
ncbi:TlpA family protein disulfide reductase [Flavobacterium bizetiae]|uniref:TlpA family protein disulfide reductase n=1 Tax=Flavobacterium bizetiae TaxID=2704140 RepID=UPI003756B5F7